MKTSREFHNARRIVIVLLLTLAVALIALPYPIPITEQQIVPFRMLSQLACIVLFSSIFIVSWNGYAIHRQSRSIVLALGFLCTAVFNFFGIASAAAAHFSSTNYLQLALLFDLMWRSLIALILLFIATEAIPGARLQVLAQWLLRAALLGVALLAALTFIYFDQIPFLRQVGSWSNHLESAIDVALIALFATASVLTYLQRKTPSDNVAEKSSLFIASTALALSEFCFSEFHAQHILLTLLGQLYQLIAVYCIYYSLVTISLRIPLVQLAHTRNALLQSRNRLDGIIQTATDGIITVDSSHRIILVNPAAERSFGYADQQMLGMHLDQFIPMRHRAGHNQHVDQFGKTGTTIRQMGVKSADFSVTGLKKNGDEFPIEASISSLTEGDQRLFTVIFRDITDRKIAKQRMEQYHRELSELSQSLQTVREEERKHIARELHDDLGQLLAALRMDITVLEKRVPDAPSLRPILVSMDALILNAIATLRRIATDLRPRALDEGGLYFALQTLQKEFRQRHAIDCDLTANENDLALDDAISTMVFRVVQESLTNVARHAKATEVHIRFSRTPDQLSFSISDNGRGIGEQDYSKRQSFGLVGMRERVRGVQGELTITSGTASGTSIAVTIPLPPSGPVQP